MARVHVILTLLKVIHNAANLERAFYASAFEK